MRAREAAAAEPDTDDLVNPYERLERLLWIARQAPLKWWQWRKRRHCAHRFLRGIYGEETTPGNRRLQCKMCRRYLDGPAILAEYRHS